MHSSAPTVSVIVPVYNGERFLPRCIESVLCQTLENLELLVIDDGSSDHSREIIQSYANVDPRVRLLHHEGFTNCGVNASRRLGVSEAQGALIALLDADDAFAPQKLKLQVDALERHAGTVMCHTGVTCLGDDVAFTAEVTRLWNGISDTEVVFNLLRLDSVFRSNPICNSSTLVRATHLKQCLMPFPQLFQFEDWTLWVLLASRGDFVFVPGPLTVYQVHAASATTKVRRNELVASFSHIEFLLTVMALSTNDEVIQGAERELRARLIDLTGTYRSRGPDSVLIPVQADCDGVTASYWIRQSHYWKQRAQVAETKHNDLVNSRTWRYASFIRHLVTRPISVAASFPGLMFQKRRDTQ